MVRAQPNDTSAIDFHLDIFLKQGLKSKSSRKQPFQYSTDTRPSVGKKTRNFNVFISFLPQNDS